MASTDGEGPRGEGGREAPALRAERVWLYADRPGKCTVERKGVRFRVVAVKRSAVAVVVDESPRDP